MNPNPGSPPKRRPDPAGLPPPANRAERRAAAKVLGRIQRRRYRLERRFEAALRGAAIAQTIIDETFVRGERFEPPVPGVYRIESSR